LARIQTAVIESNPNVSSTSPDRQREILLIRLKSIGDIVFTLPAVSQVRAAYPDARLRFLVSANLAPLMAGFRDINEVIELDRDRFRRGNLKTRISEGLSLVRRLRQPRFSLTIDLQGYGETALLSWLSRARERWGTVYARGRKWAYTRAVPRDSKVHPAEAHLGFLRACGLSSSTVRNEFAVPASDEEEARSFLTARGLRLDKPILLIQPFTSSPEKEWPIDHYLAIAQHWQEREWQVLFSGGPGDQARLQPVSQRGFAVSAGVPLQVSAGLMKLADLVVGGDTGLLHLAVAMGKRVVMLMGSAGPGSCHPFGHPEWAVVPPTGEPVAAVMPEAINHACAAAVAERGLMAGSNRR
jgi:ADP-heptose:LPS heptosyltransferase